MDIFDDGPLVIFLYGTVATPGEGFGFAHAGYAVAVIDNPDAPVATWEPRIVDASPDTFDAIPATALVRDGAHAEPVRTKGDGIIRE